MEFLSIISMIGSAELILILMPVFFLVLMIIALIDLLKHDFKGNDKIVWSIIIIFLPVLGAILYFLIGRNQQIKG